MRKVISAFLALVLVSANSTAYAAINSVEDTPQWRAQIFIANQIKGIGLVDSYQEDIFAQSYVYDNALAAIASMALGNFGLAGEILDTLAFQVQNTEQGVPAESYFYSDLNATGYGLAFAGNSAWLLQALNIYQKNTRSGRYFTIQKKLADFLLSLQDPVDGGLRGNTVDSWKSVEHNIISYVALRNFGHLNCRIRYAIKAEAIKKFLKSPAVWDGVRFNRGPNDATRVIDVQALGVMLLGKNYSSALSWAEQNLKLTRPFGATTVTGFDFNDNLDTVWLEGTLLTALAYYRINDKTRGDFYLNEAKKTQQSDGSILLATNTGNASDWWILQPWHSVAPTSWVILCVLKSSPLVLF